MYIVKNALRCIARSKGRNILMGIIALVIAVSACMGLSIRQAAENARKNALDGMSVSATVSYDRQSLMSGMGGKKNGGFDKDKFSDVMGNKSSLTLADYSLYATAESVSDFYYTLTAYFNGSDGLLPVSSTSDGGSGEEGAPSLPEGMGGGSHFGNMTTAELTVIGYSSDRAMTDFTDGSASVTDGEMFAEGTAEYACIISEELAVYNGISVGDSIVITDPSLETATYTLTVSGIYTSEEANGFSPSGFGGDMQDPANRIYMSAVALQAIADASAETEGGTVSATLSATYLFADTDAYYAFESEVRTLGLGDEYTVYSADLDAFESSLLPLDTLSKAAGWFLLVILVIGGVILVAVNAFSVRERKYEVGVLTAMGMKKRKVAVQFVCELLIVTMLAVILGAGIGAVSSVPITNTLLENQTEGQSQRQAEIDKGFGRPGNMGGELGNMGYLGDVGGGTGDPSEGSDSKGGMLGNMMGGAADYITRVDSAMDLTVALQMLGVGLLLTVVASIASVAFIMRYDPLRILANRD